MMNRDTGQGIDELAHIKQSVRDILTTPVGSRVMRREYGSMIPDLIDQPMHGVTRLQLMSATVMALIRWEPRLTVNNVQFEINADGRVVLELVANRTGGERNGEPANLSIPLKAVA